MSIEKVQLHSSLIFCDNCSTLALAELEDAPLCEACLMKTINSFKGRMDNLSIVPLQPSDANSAA